MIDRELLRSAKASLTKEAFSPVTPEAQAAAAAPPPPGMPPGMPPMDPAMMGGAPPMDPAMMGGPPPEGEEDVVKVSMDDLKALVPAANMVWLEHCSHFAHVDRPDAVTAAIISAVAPAVVPPTSAPRQK